MTIRIVGDCHGYYKEYLQLISNAEYSIQVGDLGFDYEYLRDSGVNWDNHKAIAGNHDNYNDESDEYFNYQPFSFGDYGTTIIDGKTIFFVRGAWSIDQKYRTIGLDWFPEEELSEKQLTEAIRIYKNVKPEIVVTHECPLSVVQYVTDPNFVRHFGFSQPVIKTRTNQALQVMFEYHKPKLWCFGHFHCSRNLTIENTNFICLDMIRQPVKEGCFYDLA